jgi:hypothetical protein
MATMKRCRVPMTVSGRWGSEHFWPGLEVNLERQLASGVTVADAIAGREDCFEDPEPAAADPDATTTDTVRMKRTPKE